MVIGGGALAVGGEAAAVAPEPRAWRMPVGRHWWRGHLIAGGRRGERKEGEGGGGRPGGHAGTVDAFRLAGKARRQHAGAAEAEARRRSRKSARERRRGVMRKEDEEVFRVGFLCTNL
uniref:Uncharacterized protein n=1 Tax=Oryza glumipatula TaxID=40148 RepID=A0A0E0B845_9ORYZ